MAKSKDTDRSIFLESNYLAHRIQQPIPKLWILNQNDKQKNITKAKTQTILVPIGHKQSWILGFVISELVFWSGGQDKGYYWNLKYVIYI